MTDVLYRRDVSEIYVLGRLVKSHQDGIFSAGGLLGIGDVSKYSVDGKVIQNQYKKYFNGTNFVEYWTYKSHPGFQGIAFSLFDALTDFTPARNLAIFRISVSLLLSVILAAFTLWLVDELGWLASLFVVLFILASKWFTLLGGNIYWSLWTFYLPLAVFSFLLRRLEASPKYPFSLLVIIAFCVTLVKILFSGFEFITSALLIVAVPFLYYAILNRWEWKVFLARMVSIGISLAAATVGGLLILFAQVNSVLQNNKETLDYIIFAWNKRTYGYENLLESSVGVSRKFGVTLFEVIVNYLNGYAFSLSTRLRINLPWIRDLIDGKYLFLILLFVCATVIFFFQNNSAKNSSIYRTGIVLIGTTWFSMLGPLSWLLVFRDHAAVHTRLDYIVWQMPFMLYGFALVGFVISNMRKSNR